MGQRAAARAELIGSAGAPNLKGSVTLYPYAGGSLVLAMVSGLPGNGFFGFHVHEGGRCEPRTDTAGKPAFEDALGHYNPTGRPHPQHAGDLPVLLSNRGTAFMLVYTDRFTPGQVRGRAVVVHAQPDDYRSQPAGDSGARIACGVFR